MKLNLKILANRSALALCISALMSPMLASARSQGALIGHTTDGSDAACFDWNGGGGVKNVCSTNKWWVMPAVYDNAANTTFSVGVTTTISTGNVRCSACSGDRFGSNVACGTEGTRSGTGYVQSSVFMQGFGAAWMQCLLPGSSSISTLHY